MITASDLQTITAETIQNTDKFISDLRELRDQCNTPSRSLTIASPVVDVHPPYVEVVSWSKPIQDDEITEKRAAVRAARTAAAIEYGNEHALYPEEMPLDWLASLGTFTDETYYTHPIAGSSPIDLFECGIIAHNRLPKAIELSHMSMLAAALYGHNRYYRRPTGEIPLHVNESLPDNVIVLVGSQLEENKRNLLCDQPTVEIGALLSVDVVRKPAA